MTRITFKPRAQGLKKLISDLKKKKDITNSIGKFLLGEIKTFSVAMTLPVNPESLEVTTPSDNMKINVIELGEIVIPRGVNLSSLTIESFFPKFGWAKGSLLGERVPPYVVKSVSAVFLGWTAEMYFTYFKVLQLLKVPVSLLVIDAEGTLISLDVVIESITRRNVAGDDDLHYTLELTEFKMNTPTVMKPVGETLAGTAISLVKKVASNSSTKVVPKKVVPKKVTTRIKTGFAVGDSVIVDGRYWYDSFGAKPFGTFKQFQGKIDRIISNKQALYKYHITDNNGGWKGWVSEDQLKGVS